MGTKSRLRRERQEARRLIDTWTLVGGAVDKLPPERAAIMRQVLELSLQGAGDAEVAARLGLDQWEFTDILIEMLECGLGQAVDRAGYSDENVDFFRRVAADPAKARLMHEAIALAREQGIAVGDPAFDELPPAKVLNALLTGAPSPISNPPLPLETLPLWRCRNRACNKVLAEVVLVDGLVRIQCRYCKTWNVKQEGKHRLAVAS